MLGSRYVPGGGVRDWGVLRRLISRGGGIYARTILGVGVRDLTGGFKCIRREVLEAIDLAQRPRRGLRVPDRGHLPRAAGRLHACARSRSCSPTGRRARARCRRGSPLEAMWMVPALQRSAERAPSPEPEQPVVTATGPGWQSSHPNVISMSPTPQPDGSAGILYPMSVRSPLGATPQSAGFELPARRARAPRGASQLSRRGLIGARRPAAQRLPGRGLRGQHRSRCCRESIRPRCPRVAGRRVLPAPGSTFTPAARWPCWS